MGTTVLIPKTTHVEFDIPEELVGQEIEFTYNPVKRTEKPKKTMKDFLGILSDESAEKLREHVKLARDEWDRNI